MKELVIDYKPFEFQQSFHSLPNKFRSFIGGVGSGKTMAGSAEAIVYSINNPKSVGCIVAPTYRMLDDVTMVTFFQLLPKDLIQEYRKGDKVLLLRNGSKVYFRSADQPEKLRGLNLSWFWIDEAALVSEMTWKIMLGRIRSSKFPNKGWITTTPKGFTWIYRRFLEKKNKDYGMVQCSSRDNPFLPPDFIESLQEEYVGVFAKQEIEGEFVGFEGVVFPSFKRGVHVMDCKKKEFQSMIYGIDWGYTNSAVVLAIGLDSDNRMHVVEEFYEKGILIEGHAEAVVSLQKKYGEGVCVADPSEPEHIRVFRNNNLTVIEANNKILPGITKVASQLEIQKDDRPRLFVDPSCVNTIMEFENYRYPESKEEKPVQENPLKIHDHAMDALRYVAMHLDKGPEFVVLEDRGLLF